MGSWAARLFLGNVPRGVDPHALSCFATQPEAAQEGLATLAR